MPKKKYYINILLLIITFITTTSAGALNEGVNIFISPFGIVKGLPFSITLMIILGAHETAHYVFARREGVEATYPYFIPAPSFLGTFGAFIKIKSPIPDRKALVQFSAAGPIAGFLMALPAVIAGLLLSEVRPMSGMDGIPLGSSLLFSLLSKIILGSHPDSFDIVLHPVAFAGWIGFFVTALNLLPVGQLDGGHILYSLSKKWHRRMSRGTFWALLPLGFYWPGWFVWIALLSFLGLKHPPLVDESLHSSHREKYLGALSLLIFVLTFIPVPFSL